MSSIAEPQELPVIRPNMLVIGQDATSSTFAGNRFDHSVLMESTFFNSRFVNGNFEGVAFDNVSFDGAIATNCSLRGVELRNCDVDSLIINGVNIGHVLKLLLGSK
jgi:uncharacterized protein YjbI with pentapeptide repeats